jgi:hypothetical protein
VSAVELTVGGQVVRVATDCREFRDVLVDVFGGRARVVDDLAAPEVFVRRHAPLDPDGAALFEAIEERGAEVVVNPGSALHRFRAHGRELALGEARHAVWFPASRTLVRCDEEPAGARVRVDSPCLGRPPVIETYASDDAFRVVRNAVYLALLDGGRAWMHSAAVVDADGGATLIVGDNRAGKTLTLLSLLDRGGAFAANGRTFLDVRDGRVDLVACPERIMLRPGHLAAFPALAALGGPGGTGAGSWAEPESRKLPVFHRDFARVLGRPWVDEATVVRLVFPALGRGPLDGPPAYGRGTRAAILRRSVQDEEAYDECSWFRPPARRRHAGDHEELIEALLRLPHRISWLGESGLVRIGEAA